MGLHSPFGYVGYQSIFLDIFINILDTICTGCHTNEDFYGGCSSCPAGNFLFEIKKYVLDSIEFDTYYQGIAAKQSDQDEELKWISFARQYESESKIIREIKFIIQDIKPNPFFNASWITDAQREPDKLYALREKAKDLKFIGDHKMLSFKIEHELRRAVATRMRDELKMYYEKPNESITNM